jgi:hypothetical protein
VTAKLKPGTCLLSRSFNASQVESVKKRLRRIGDTGLLQILDDERKCRCLVRKAVDFGAHRFST